MHLQQCGVGDVVDVVIVVVVVVVDAVVIGCNYTNIPIHEAGNQLHLAPRHQGH